MKAHLLSIFAGFRFGIDFRLCLHMITLDDFQILTFSKQCDFITVFADYLLYRVEEEKKYYLYAMGDYFVQVCYLPAEGKVMSIDAFYDLMSLDPYMDFIDISDLGL